MENHKLTVTNIKHSYCDGQQKTTILDNVSAEFVSGKMYAIQGESGSGKTTLISLISALDSVQSGDIKFDGKSIKEIGATEFRRRYVAIVFQSYNLIRYMTARENVEVALDFSGRKDKDAYFFLEEVGISRDKADRLIQKLSGGEQQRVAIARAMASDTPIVVADEPTGNIDEKNESKILDLFHQLARNDKIVIIVTHSAKVAGRADVVYYIKDGKMGMKK